MKITDVRPVLFWATNRNVLVVVVETDQGITGYGQAYAHIQATTEAVRMLAPRVIGQDATRIDHLWQSQSLVAMSSVGDYRPMLPK